MAPQMKKACYPADLIYGMILLFPVEINEKNRFIVLNTVGIAIHNALARQAPCNYIIVNRV
jgi:hypothetical protein